MHTDPNKHTTVDQSVHVSVCVCVGAGVHTRQQSDCAHGNKPYYKGCFKFASVQELTREPAGLISRAYLIV